MTGDQPMGVVAVGKLEQCQAQVLDSLEALHPQQVLLEGADEALGDARNSSVSMVISPTLPFSRTISSSRSSLLRSLSAASAGQQGPIPPFRQPRRRHVELPCQQLQWFAPQQAGRPLAASASPNSVAEVARRRTCLRQLLGGAPTSPPAPSRPSPSFRPFGSPSFAVRLTAAECLNKPRCTPNTRGSGMKVHWHVHDEHHNHQHAPLDLVDKLHTHWHVHDPVIHWHPHYPDLHHRHDHAR